MSARRLNTLVLLLALGVIGGAWFFQLGLHLVPCELCLKERVPWYAALVLALLGLVLPSRAARPLSIIFCVLFAGSSGFALYHVGIEQHLIPGPTACTAPAVKGQSIEDLTAQLLATPVVQCDKIQWSLFGISLAGWNFFASLSGIIFAAIAWFRRVGDWRHHDGAP